jgi:hypothetical protein
MMAPIVAVVIIVWIVDIAPDMPWIVTAAIIVGIIIVDRAWANRQVNPHAAARTFGLGPGRFFSRDFFSLERGLRDPPGISHRRNEGGTHHEQASHQTGGE